MQRVEHEGKIHEFPSEATPEMIAKALNVTYRPKVMQEQDNVPMSLKLLMSLQKPLSVSIPERASALKRGIQDIGEGLKQGYLTLGEHAGYKPKGTTEEFTREAEQGRKEYEQSPEGQDILAQILRGGISNAPSFMLGGIGMGIGKNILAKMMGSGVGSAIGAGGSFIPKPEERAEHMIKSGAIGAAIPGAYAVGAKAIPAIKEALSPTSLISKFAKPGYSKEEILRNMEAAAGTETGVGSIIGSPGLQRAQENIISKIPFTGSEGSVNRTGKIIFDRGEKLINKYKGNYDPSELTEKLEESLMGAQSREKSIKNALYENVNNMADQSGLQLTLPNFSNLARKHIKDIESSNILKFEPDVKSLLSKLNIYKNPVKTEEITSNILSKEGLPISKGVESTYPSLQESNILSSKLRYLSDQYRSSANPGDRNAARILGDLSRAIKGDIRNEIKNTGNESLIKEFNNAEKNYAENFSNLLDKTVLQFTSGKKLPEDLVSTFLKTSKTSDKAEQLDKLLKVIPKEDHDMIRYAYLSRALQGEEGMKVVNPAKLKTLWNNLGDNQKKLLFPDKEQRKELDNYVRLVQMNPKAVHKMFNPMTGQMNSDLLTGYMLMNPIKSLKEISIGMLGNKLLTSEKSRQKIVGKTIKKMEKE
jgi:hypothetical protein